MTHSRYWYAYGSNLAERIHERGYDDALAIQIVTENVDMAGQTGTPEEEAIWDGFMARWNRLHRDQSNASK